MAEHQIHFGRKFYLDKDFGYWISTDYPRIRAHRWVWMNHYGEIPEGHHIHHIDENKSNNEISNLQLLLGSEHLSLHITEEKKEKLRVWADSIRPMTKEWHASKEGREWHKIHAKNHSFGKWDLSKYTCKHCNSEYESRKKSRTSFCSNSCKSAWRRNQGFDDEGRRCERCDKIFLVNRYAKTRFCSKYCSGKCLKPRKLKGTQLFLTL
jgi:hypothetical protein